MVHFCAGGGFFLEECLGGVGTLAVRSAPCDGSWQAVLVVTVALVQRGGSTFVREGFFLEERLGGVETWAVRSAPPKSPHHPGTLPKKTPPHKNALPLRHNHSTDQTSSCRATRRRRSRSMRTSGAGRRSSLPKSPCSSPSTLASSSPSARASFMEAPRTS